VTVRSEAAYLFGAAGRDAVASSKERGMTESGTPNPARPGSMREPPKLRIERSIDYDRGKRSATRWSGNEIVPRPWNGGASVATYGRDSERRIDLSPQKVVLGAFSIVARLGRRIEFGFGHLCIFVRRPHPYGTS